MSTATTCTTKSTSRCSRPSSWHVATAQAGVSRARRWARVVLRRRNQYAFGDDSVGKTWVSLSTALDVMRRGGTVVHLDWDDSWASNVWRLNKLGATGDVP